jgi:hypothetical protein
MSGCSYARRPASRNGIGLSARSRYGASGPERLPTGGLLTVKDPWWDGRTLRVPLPAR